MLVKRAGNAILVWTPAKLNLFLEVLRRRDDGFHEIETLMSAVRWRDTLYFQPNSTGQLSLDCHWAYGLEARRNNPHVLPACRAYANLPPTEENLVMRAARMMQSEALRQPETDDATAYGAAISLRKRIPSAAGLGGASSDAAAVIVAANLAWNLGWSQQRLCEIAARLGSDVPFFLVEQSAVCRGRGEIIEPFAARGVQYYVIVKPAAGLSTAEVYQQCRPASHPRVAAPLRRAMESGSRGQEQWYFNRLSEAALAVSPQLSQLPRDLEQISKCRAFMSGSGTSHFVPCRNARHGRRVAALARGRGLGAVCCSVSADKVSRRTACDENSSRMVCEQ